MLNKRVTVRVEPELDRQLDEIAKKTGKGKSECIRQMISASVNDKKTDMESQELFLQRKRLIYEINQIGKNINQIAHNENSDIYKLSDRNRLLYDMERLKQIVNEKLR